MNRFSSLSRPHIILMIGDEGVLAVPHKVPDRSNAFFVAEKDERGAEGILELIEKYPRVPLTFFADNLAQDFRLETVPRLNPLDRPKLIARRLQQAFPQAALTASLNCRRDRTQVLFAGMHGDGPVFKWLERIRERCPKRVPHIALLPAESADMVCELLPNAKDGWALLLSRQRTGGFRQIVTHKGELIFTRLTPPLPLSARASEIAEAITRDIKASLGYLGRMGLADPAELHVALLMPEALHPSLKFLSLPGRSLRLLTPHDAATELGLPLSLDADEACSDLLYAGWLAAKRKPRLPMVPPDLRQAGRTATIREWGWRAAAAALVFAFAVTGWQTKDLLTTLWNMREETTQLAELQHKLTDEQATAAPITEPLGRLRQAVERRRIFMEPVTMPWETLRTFGSALGNEAHIVKFEWRSDERKPGSQIMEADIRFSDSATNKDRPAVVARFQKLAQNVAQAMPGYDVQMTRYPFPALPDEALSNDGAGKNPAGRRYGTADDTEDAMNYLVALVSNKYGDVPPPLRGRLGGGSVPQRRSSVFMETTPPLTPPSRGGESHRSCVGRVS